MAANGGSAVRITGLKIPHAKRPWPQFTVEDPYAIKNSIYSIRRFHVKNGCDIVSFDDVLLDLDSPNRGKNHRQESDHDVPPK